MSISVLGAGAFGTALAISLAEKSPVTLWSRDAEQASAMRATGENTKRLPGLPLPASLTPSSDLSEALASEILLLAIPMQLLRGFLGEIQSLTQGKSLVACCKGIELKTGLGPIEVLLQSAPDAYPALLTGPSFAADIARGLPTALTLASPDKAQGKRLQEELTTANLRLYRTGDTIGAELGGALKNVMAIACGAVMGAGLGDSARAALMTRGYAEMQRMALACGARPETLAGLSGFGDLALTCTSDLSRNYQLGLSIGRGAKFDPKITVEGAATARATLAKAQTMGIEMPITETVDGLLDGDLTIATAGAQLLARPLKEE